MRQPVTVTINDFSGGLPDDVRELKANTFVTSKGFDATIYPNRLVPYLGQEDETIISGTMEDNRCTNVSRDTNGYIYAIGRTSSAVPTGVTIFSKSSGTDLTSNYVVHSSLAVGWNHRSGTFVQYLNGFYFMDTVFGVRKMTFPNTFSLKGTLATSSTWADALSPKPLLHSLDKCLYFAGIQALAKIDASDTYSNLTNISIPTTQMISSLAEYGEYVAIATVPNFTGGRSSAYLWNKSTTVTAFQEVIEWGEGSLLILENVGGTLIGVSASTTSYTNATTYTTSKVNKITVRAYSGGQAVIIKEIVVASNVVLRNYKETVNGRLFFGCDNDDSLYAIYKNKLGQIVVTKDRYMALGDTITTLRGFSIIGDYLWIGYDTASTTGNFKRTVTTATYNSSSIFETISNPNMIASDRTELKKLVSVSVGKNTTTGTMSIQFSADGGVTYYTLGTVLGGIVNKMTGDANGNPNESGYDFRFRVVSDNGAELCELKYEYQVQAEII